MNNKTKRIKAKKMTDEVVYIEDTNGKGRMVGTEGYFIAKADVRALAEQMAVETGERVQSERKKAKLPPLADTVLKHESKNMTRAMLYLFNLHGITPGRARKGTK